ncbi:hypothetical protein CA13_25330 [Planctomycetes bacterium CA13]|uniref:Transmembrane protein n=1 Tax=Novipirellula herctigrandis TaxID=2527986 RepID=A0A5C5Z239_9BACT|nr:hypothetical protein CA13_25330 [Planctomycetes bacterium CA13]
MSEILLYYKRPDPTTWVYLSSFLTIGLFFVFHRFWSIRNLDIILLILLAPGLLMVHEGWRRQIDEIESEVVAQRHPEPVFPDTSPPQDTNENASGENNAPIPNPLSSDAALGESTHDSTVQQSEMFVSLLGMIPQEIGLSQEQKIGADLPDTEGSIPVANANPGGDHDDSQPHRTAVDPQSIRRFGFIYLFFVQFLILIRLLLDPLMVRRPQLDPNLTSGGLTFIGVSLFIFMMANIVYSTPRIQIEQGPKLGPGYALMNMLPAIPTRPVTDALAAGSPTEEAKLSESQAHLATLAKVLAIFAHGAIVVGIVLIGNWHFSNMKAGVGCATLYLMLPYTAQMTGRVDHALPAALLLWAVLSYRKPLLAGIFFGLASGLVYYPLFLLPLWISFYWRRGVWRFVLGVGAMLGLLMILLSFAGTESIIDHLRAMFGLFLPERKADNLGGIWGLGWNPIWRLPVIVAFVILCSFLAAWPAQKNLGTLIGCSAAVMVGAQFWHGYGGGLYIAWFLPLLLLTIFRPNLQDRIATKVVSDTSILPFRRSPIVPSSIAPSPIEGEPA